jgi:hypothetical protein
MAVVSIPPPSPPPPQTGVEAPAPGESLPASSTSAGGNAAALPPSLPWPPPYTPIRGLVDPEKFREALGAGPHTFNNAAGFLRRALADAGYGTVRYLGAPGGFAMITQIEQIDEDGVPLDDLKQRYSDSIAWEPAPFWDPVRILLALFEAPRGYFRIIKLVVTDQHFGSNAAPETAEVFEAWQQEGLSTLPPDERSKDLTADHDVTVLIYEFYKEDDAEPPRISQRRIPPRQHLGHTSLAALF